MYQNKHAVFVVHFFVKYIILILQISLYSNDHDCEEKPQKQISKINSSSTPWLIPEARTHDVSGVMCVCVCRAHRGSAPEQMMEWSSPRCKWMLGGGSRGHGQTAMKQQCDLQLAAEQRSPHETPPASLETSTRLPSPSTRTKAHELPRSNCQMRYGCDAWVSIQIRRVNLGVFDFFMEEGKSPS